MCVCVVRILASTCTMKSAKTPREKEMEGILLGSLQPLLSPHAQHSTTNSHTPLLDDYSPREPRALALIIQINNNLECLYLCVYVYVYPSAFHCVLKCECDSGTDTDTDTGADTAKDTNKNTATDEYTIQIQLHIKISVLFSSVFLVCAINGSLILKILFYKERNCFDL